MSRSPEPVLWSLFGAGGALSALFVPVLFIALAIAVPLGLASAPSYGHLRAIVGHPLARVVLFGVAALSATHAAHRFRFTLYDGLQLKHLNALIAVLCYGSALCVSAAAAYILFLL